MRRSYFGSEEIRHNRLGNDRSRSLGRNGSWRFGWYIAWERYLGCLAWCICCLLGIWISVRLHDIIFGKQIKQFEKERKVAAFYEECKKYGIQDLKKLDAAEKQRVQLIAEKHAVDLSDPKVIQDFNTVRDRKEKEAAEKQEKKALADKQTDQEQYEKLSRYAQLHGNKKPVAMF